MPLLRAAEQLPLRPGQGVRKLFGSLGFGFRVLRGRGWGAVVVMVVFWISGLFDGTLPSVRGV